MKDPDLRSGRKNAEQTVNCFMEWLRIHEFKMCFSQLWRVFWVIYRYVCVDVCNIYLRYIHCKTLQQGCWVLQSSQVFCPTRLKKNCLGSDPKWSQVTALSTWWTQKPGFDSPALNGVEKSFILMCTHPKTETKTNNISKTFQSGWNKSCLS